MAQGTAADPRLTTWMINSSGGFSADQKLNEATHGPVLIVLGARLENLSKLTQPIMLFSKDIGRGATCSEPVGTSTNSTWRG